MDQRLLKHLKDLRLQMDQTDPMDHTDLLDLIVLKDQTDPMVLLRQLHQSVPERNLYLQDQTDLSHQLVQVDHLQDLTDQTLPIHLKDLMDRTWCLFPQDQTDLRLPTLRKDQKNPD
jgi:hypothetical protein